VEIFLWNSYTIWARANTNFRQLWPASPASPTPCHNPPAAYRTQLHVAASSKKEAGWWRREKCYPSRKSNTGHPVCGQRTNRSVTSSEAAVLRYVEQRQRMQASGETVRLCGSSTYRLVLPNIRLSKGEKKPFEWRLEVKDKDAGARPWSAACVVRITSVAVTLGPPARSYMSVWYTCCKLHCTVSVVSVPVLSSAKFECRGEHSSSPDAGRFGASMLTCSESCSRSLVS
jgi:hypothetical protein